MKIMTLCIGTKLIKAVAMDRAAYNTLRGWEVPADENPADEGFLVEYLDGGQANHPDFKGYISWSPKGVFEKAYQPCEGDNQALTFGDAIHFLKQGAKVARKGWNGADQFVYLVRAASYPAQTGVAKQHFGENAKVPYRAYLALKTAQGDVATWAPSCSDALAEDWVVLQ